MGSFAIAFVMVLLGVGFYSLFLGVEQRRLNRELELLEQMRKRSPASPSTNVKAA